MSLNYIGEVRERMFEVLAKQDGEIFDLSDQIGIKAREGSTWAYSFHFPGEEVAANLLGECKAKFESHGLKVVTGLEECDAHQGRVYSVFPSGSSLKYYPCNNVILVDYMDVYRQTLIIDHSYLIYFNSTIDPIPHDLPGTLVALTDAVLTSKILAAGYTSTPLPSKTRIGDDLHDSLFNLKARAAVFAGDTPNRRSELDRAVNRERRILRGRVRGTRRVADLPFPEYEPIPAPLATEDGSSTYRTRERSSSADPPSPAPSPAPTVYDEAENVVDDVQMEERPIWETRLGLDSLGDDERGFAYLGAMPGDVEGYINPLFFVPRPYIAPVPIEEAQVAPAVVIEVNPIGGVQVAEGNEVPEVDNAIEGPVEAEEEMPEHPDEYQAEQLDPVPPYERGGYQFPDDPAEAEVQDAAEPELLELAHALLLLAGVINLGRFEEGLD